MADRAKREKKTKLAKLAELKRAREGGGRSWVQEEDANLYDEVSEEQYKRIVKGRLAKDDFVVDDGPSGYNDNGMDDWDEQDRAVDSDEDDYRSTKRACVHHPAPTPLHLNSLNSKEASERRQTSRKTQGSPTGSCYGFDHFVPSS